jgi:predicted RNA-binding Zn-ribbon protein involved in translation (DUF1610 family)
MANKKILSRKQLEPDSKYSYCPACAKALLEAGRDLKNNLPPLFKVVTSEWQEDTKREYIDFHYECPKCGNKNITAETFYEAYCKF